jgi:hypothetical protein
LNCQAIRGSHAFNVEQNEILEASGFKDDGAGSAQFKKDDVVD